MAGPSGVPELPARVYATNADWPREALTLLDGDQPLDLTGAALRMQLRTDPSSATAYVDVTSPDHGITVLDAAAGTISIWVPASQMALIPPGAYRRELLLIRGTDTIIAGQGDVTIVQGLVR